MTSTQELFRKLPSVDVLLTTILSSSEKSWLERYPRPLIKELINTYLDALRESIKKGKINCAELDVSFLIKPLLMHIKKKGAPHFTRVINATGVVIHTNLGRSLLAKKAVDAVCQSASYYSNLEFDLETGKRGTRYSHVEKLICSLTGAEAALVVNNNAAAVLLVLDTLCRGGEVIVSRGELVEIGGSFRIPSIMEKSGCCLKEIGTTNRTHIEDYSHAIGEHSKAIMKVHTSNYRINGFTKSISVKELRPLADENNILLIEDLGSGSLLDFPHCNLSHFGDEPTVQQEVAFGIDILTFSGDKVLGGPQAGIIIGKKKYIDSLKKNHLTRALRIDKMTLAALEATLRLYIEPESAIKEIPTLSMTLIPEEELRKKAKKLATLLTKSSSKISTFLQPSESYMGGGAFPEKSLPTTIVVIEHQHLSAQEIKEAFLKTSPPVIGRIEHDYFCLDPRTLLEEEFAIIANCLKSLEDECLN